MPRLTTTQRVRRPSNGERVFTDDKGSIWSASFVPGGAGDGNAIVFACISDSRQSVRAIAADPELSFAEVHDDTLRAWLRDAPRIGRLT